MYLQIKKCIFVTTMISKKLLKARRKIDLIDNQIFLLIKKRTIVVKEMLNLKKTKKQIIDHKRIKSILNNVKKKSLKNNIDPVITYRIWKSIIWSYVNFQKKNFKKK